MIEKGDSIYRNSITEKLADDIHGDNNAFKINPWKKPISNITWGFILSIIKLNFLWLQYILPTVGAVLIFVGVRILRKENKYFSLAYVLSIVVMFLRAVYLVFVSTPLITEMQNGTIISLLAVCLQLIIIFTFRLAIKNVFIKVDTSMPRDPFLLAALWILLAVILALSPLSNSWLAFIPLLFFYIHIIRSLNRLGDDLGDIGYCFTNNTVKFSNPVVIRGYLLICFLLVVICGAVASHSVPDFTELKLGTAPDTRNKLLDLGIPEEILSDMSDENISMLQNAINVNVYTDLLMFDGVSETVEVDMNIYEEHIKPKNQTIEATTVYTELPGNEVYVLVYFKWQKPKAFWNDGFTIWGEEGIELLDGKLIYYKDNTDYVAPIPRLNNDFVTTRSMFFGANQSKQITGGVCYPFGSENQRGYIFYRLSLSEENGIVANCINYLHSSSPVTLPYTHAEQKILSGRREYKQHYTTYDLKKYQDMQD